MSAVLDPEQTAAAIGPWATAAQAYELLTVDVPAEHWIEALTAARDGLGLGFFDWLSAVDELAEGFSVSVHLAAVGEAGAVRHLLLRTRVPRDGAALPTAAGVYAGASWHERETHEMFGIAFTGHPHLVPLLLPEGFEGHPLRKEFVLAARVAKAWPGAKEPGESDHGDGPARRKMQPAGVPDPNEWGPLKGTLPPVAERPARAARGPRAAGAGAAGAGAGAAAAAAAEGGRPVRADRPRRNRSITEGSASQAATAAAAPTAEAPQAAAPQAEAPKAEAPQTEAPQTEAPQTGAPQTETPKVARTQSSDAPWHSPVPAYDEPEKSAEPTSGVPDAEPEKSAEPTSDAPSAPDTPTPDTASPEAASPEPPAEPKPQPPTPQDGDST